MIEKETGQRPNQRSKDELYFSYHPDREVLPFIYILLLPLRGITSNTIHHHAVPVYKSKIPTLPRFIARFHAISKSTLY